MDSIIDDSDKAVAIIGSSGGMVNYSNKISAHHLKAWALNEKGQTKDSIREVHRMMDAMQQAALYAKSSGNRLEYSKMRKK